MHIYILYGNIKFKYSEKNNLQSPNQYHPKHVEQFPDINELRNVAFCWIYIGTLLGAHRILHISRIRVNWDAQPSGYAENPDN
jgi:hypothetical protein